MNFYRKNAHSCLTSLFLIVAIYLFVLCAAARLLFSPEGSVAEIISAFLPIAIVWLLPLIAFAIFGALIKQGIGFACGTVELFAVVAGLYFTLNYPPLFDRMVENMGSLLLDHQRLMFVPLLGAMFLVGGVAGSSVVVCTAVVEGVLAWLSDSDESRPALLFAPLRITMIIFLVGYAFEPFIQELVRILETIRGV
jgi:hypothetical protein